MIRSLAVCAQAGIFLARMVSGAAEVFPVVHNQPIVLRVVDGKAGRPQPGRHVVLSGGYDLRDLRLGEWQEEAVTNGEGTVLLSNELRNLPYLRVEVLKSHPCERGARQSAYSVERIRAAGQSGANRCGTVVVAEEPGFLTVFVKGKDASGGNPLRIRLPAAIVAASSQGANLAPSPANGTPLPALVTRVEKATPSESLTDDVPAHGKEPVPGSAEGLIPIFLSFPTGESFESDAASLQQSVPVSAPILLPAGPRTHPRFQVHAPVPVATPVTPLKSVAHATASSTKPSGTHPLQGAFHPAAEKDRAPRRIPAPEGKPASASPRARGGKADSAQRAGSAPERLDRLVSGSSAERPRLALKADPPRLDGTGMMPIFRLKEPRVAPTPEADLPVPLPLAEDTINLLCMPNPR